jgi:hypothetical protein
VHAMHPKNHSPCVQKIKSSHRHHTVYSESTKQNESQTQKILQILATASPPSSEFYWVPDIEHFTLYYQDKYTGIIIYISSNIGLFRIHLGDYELISVSTLRQAQAICHTIAWIFRNSLPISNYTEKKSTCKDRISIFSIFAQPPAVSQNANTVQAFERSAILANVCGTEEVPPMAGLMNSPFVPVLSVVAGILYLK